MNRTADRAALPLSCAVVWVVAASIIPGRVRAEDPLEILRRVQTIPLEGVEGRMDHLALDTAGRTLYLAALANNTFEVVDLQAGRRTRQVRGFKEPQGVVLIPRINTLVVTSGEDGRCRFLDPALNVIAEIDELPDADNVRYDPIAERVYVAYGDGALAVIDATTHKMLSDIRLTAHPESFQLESSGHRIFANVPDAQHVVVIDRRSGAVTTTWPVIGAKKNYPMALDEVNHRLFVGCRQPAKFVVFDTETGRQTASLDACGDADDIFIDRQTGRIYVTGGEGCISVFAPMEPDNYTEVARIQTAAGARTSLFVPETRKLYLAVPHRDDQLAAIWVYETAP